MFDIPVLYEACGHSDNLAILQLTNQAGVVHYGQKASISIDLTLGCFPRETDDTIQLLFHFCVDGDTKLCPEVHINVRLEFFCLVANCKVALDHLRLYTPKTHLAAR